VGGFMGVTGPKGTGWEPCKAGVAVTDMMTGLYAHGAILAALLHRQTTGRGQKIECDLLSTQMAAMSNLASNYLNVGMEGRPMGTEHPSIGGWILNSRVVWWFPKTIPNNNSSSLPSLPNT
jgi:succinate---hydroxymethylglutarate CoA-transferase